MLQNGNMSAVTWVRSVGQGDSDRQIAMRAKIPTGTLGRQLANDLLSPENIVAIARAYRVSPLDGLVALGLITDEEVRSAGVRSSLSDVRDEDLVGEVLQRVRAGKDDHPILTTPLAE